MSASATLSPVAAGQSPAHRLAPRLADRARFLAQPRDDGQGAARHPGQVLSQVQLLDRVWGYDFDGSSNVVEVYVSHLRRRIGAHRIQTVRGAGYRLVES